MADQNESLDTDSEQAWEPGQLLLDDFEVQQVLGQGGMGKVYLVRSRTTAMEFAVKHALIKDDKNRQNFLSELQTWIDLPEHPHIAACRFFRTIGDEIAIFSEYVGGGTLADWIRDRRLATLEQILDVAIQFAWGLQALHEHGLIHQDVKPGNVLMTPEGVAKVTDFSLARARLRGSDGQVHSPTPAPNGHSVLVSFGGMTQAYCSPEQAARQSLSRKTDIWSWGVSVLDMFYGETSCRYGQTAGESLEAYFQEGTLDQELPRMPVEITMLLGKCFLPKPEQRWDSMGEVADALVQVYPKICDRAYNSKAPKVSPGTKRQVPSQDCRTSKGCEWAEPSEWLERALREDARDPADAAEIVARQGSSRRGQLVADVAAYDEARRMYERLIQGGRKDLENDLATLCHNAAFVHEATDDSFGALALYDLAIEIRERLINVEGRGELANDLAALYQSKANAVMSLGDNRVAVDLNDRAIEIIERLVNVENRRELTNHLATLYMNKAIAVTNLGDNRAAERLYDLAIEIRERLVSVEGQSEWADNLARLYQNKATTVMALGDNRAAVDLNDRAIEIFEQLVNVENQRELAGDLAKVYMNKAIAVENLGDNRAAEGWYDRAIAIRERQVNVEGRRELANDLAMVYMNKAVAVMNLGEHRSAARLCDRAIEIRERLVNAEGRRELAGDLAKVYMNKAIAVKNLGDYRAAVRFYDRAIEIIERLVTVENRRELANDLAMVYMNKANALTHLGDNRAAVGWYDRAIEIRDRLVNQEGREELLGDLAWNRGGRGVALTKLGEINEGLKQGHEAAAILQAEVARTSRADLQAVLNWLRGELSKVEKAPPATGSSTRK